MTVTIYDFIDLFTDPKLQQIEIYSLGKETTVYEGTLGDETLYDEFGAYEIRSIDTLFYPSDKITINID